MLEDIEKWMDGEVIRILRVSAESFQGRKLRTNFPYQRAQYIDLMMNSDDILKKYKVIN